MVSERGTRRHLRHRPLVWERDRGICWLCGKPADPDAWHCDHLIPRHAAQYVQLEPGETYDSFMLAITDGHWEDLDHPDNLAVSHPRCNTARRNWGYTLDPRRLDQYIEEAFDQYTGNLLRRLRQARFRFTTGTYDIRERLETALAKQETIK